MCRTKNDANDNTCSNNNKHPRSCRTFKWPNWVIKNWSMPLFDLLGQITRYESRSECVAWCRVAVHSMIGLSCAFSLYSCLLAILSHTLHCLLHSTQMEALGPPAFNFCGQRFTRTDFT